MDPEQVKAVVIAVDPGTRKCGIATLSRDGKTIYRDIVPRGEIVYRIKGLMAENPRAAVVVGGSTQGKEVCNALLDSAGMESVLVDEAHTTDEAREVFWRENRAGCFWGIFPPSFRPLPRHIDDYAAEIIGRRFLAQSARRADDG